MKKIINKYGSAFLLILVLSSMNFNQDEWRNLFNGKNLNGWEIKQGSAKFEVIDGEIIATSILNTTSTYLGTRGIYSDFILEFEVYVTPGLNSGVQFRSSVYNKQDSELRAGQVYGYQCELDTDEFRSWTGGIYDQSRRDLFLADKKIRLEEKNCRV